jgi:hypothetical protein
MMMIHTPATLRSNRRRLDRRLQGAEQVLNALQAGDALHFQYTRSGPCWTLTNGRPVSDKIARLVIASSSVVGVGDALFRGTASQTWRWWRT